MGCDSEAEGLWVMGDVCGVRLTNKTRYTSETPRRFAFYVSLGLWGNKCVYEQKARGL